jgi:signal transduction histidine kinase
MARVRTRFRIPPPPQLPAAANLFLAILLPAGALIVEIELRHWIEHIPFVLFFLVVSLVASLGGWTAGFLATAVSTGCGYTFLATSPSADRAAGALLGSVVFVPVACLITGIAAVVRAGFRERERATHELTEAVRLRDQFISTASHELKTPLTSMSLVVQQMRRVAKGEHVPDAERRLLVLERHTQRLGRLINGLLDVSRFMENRLPLHFEEFELSDAVRDAASAFDEEVRRSGGKLSIDGSHGIVGEWDRSRVEHIIANLVSNALKYGGGEPIHVSVRASGGDALLVVRDEGMGIPTHDHVRIFERFERGEHGSGYSGFGLGLWIVREFAESMGGSVQVESAPGAGATFTVKLPVRRKTS